MSYSMTAGYGQSTQSTYFTSAGSYSTRMSYTMSMPAYSMPTAYNLRQRESALNFEAGQFLNPERPQGKVIICEEEIKEMIEEAFEKVTGTEFPKQGIKIVICEEQEFIKAHSSFGRWSPGIMGFSLNRYGKGTSEIYVRQAQLDELMLTIGHEIGHVMSRTLPDKKDEEAKAHAFSLAWIETIREYNIGGLKPHITPNPAQNGLHDVAFDYVKRLLHNGMNPYDIFQTLSGGLMSIIAEVS